ncbi:MAG: LPS translocon maturation chaperone LptM [Gammaproteobacteria bacterium]
MRTLLLAVLLSLLAGCGQKGPLVLPPEPPASPGAGPR